jgi:phenylalanyl-tRNA synthetase beta chain
MPSVQFTLNDLEELLGSRVPHDKDGLNQILAYVKGDVESLDELNGIVNIEVKDSNHPDIWSVEGIARALRGFLGKTPSKPPKVSGRSTLKVVIDKRVQPIRPFIAVAVVKGVNASDEALKSWLGLQEKMDLTYGRKRRKASIGLYQSDLVKSPLNYSVAKPSEVSFAPLGYEEEMTLADMVEKHPKGVEYGPIISSFKEWPLLSDGNGKILSLPPVINSNDLGKITTSTENILVEVTGTNLETVHNTLKIVVTALSERGGRIYSCTLNYPYGSPRRIVTPDLDYRPSKLSISYANRLLGTNLSSREVARLLEKASYHARPRGRDTVRVEIPCYRLDIMHQVDLIEDVAIAHNLNKLEPEWPTVWTPGGLSAQTDQLDIPAEVMVGLGYQELLTYSLTSPESLEQKMNVPPSRLVELKNPKITTLTTLRNWLLPSLMEFLSSNTHVDYPQKVFEVGTCASPEGETVGQVVNQNKVAAVTVHASAGFTEIRACLDTLLQNLDIDFTVTPSTHPSFLDGRFGTVRSGEKQIGLIGELHPEVIKAWGLNLPAAAFELEV